MASNGLEVLENWIREEICKADRRRKKHKWVSLSIRLLASVFTAAIPVLLGLRFSDPPPPSLQVRVADVAMVLAALATILNGWDAFYGHREL